MRIAEGEVVAGRYRLEKPLARGGMGAVWVARHRQLDSRVAIKFMDPTLASSSAARARFEREAKSAAQIHSPHVVHVYDYGVEEDTPFLAMELLDGEDLGTRIKRHGPLSLGAAADIIVQVARALRVAHAAGIVHRDLKPANIFLATNDNLVVAKVLDFGIAKTVQRASVDDEGTKTDQMLGSPQYMSPEQARRSRDVDARTDLWALGVIAYRAITGKLPFTGDPVEVLVRICMEPAAPPSVHKPELPPTLDRFFERALAKSPDHRFQTAAELADAFVLAAGVRMTAEPVLLRKEAATTKRMLPSAAALLSSRAEAPPASELHVPDRPARASQAAGSGTMQADELSPDLATVPRAVGAQREAPGPVAVLVAMPAEGATIPTPVPVPVPTPAAVRRKSSTTTVAAALTLGVVTVGGLLYALRSRSEAPAEAAATDAGAPAPASTLSGSPGSSSSVMAPPGPTVAPAALASPSAPNAGPVPVKTSAPASKIRHPADRPPVDRLHKHD
jgi:serine/threonine protein kinase